MKIEELIENLEYVEKIFGNIEVNIDCPYGGIPNFKIPNFGVGEIGEFSIVADKNGEFKLFINYDNLHCVNCKERVIDHTSEYGLCSECENN
jgi:hypothetical protein